MLSIEDVQFMIQPYRNFVYMQGSIQGFGFFFAEVVVAFAPKGITV